MFAIHFLDKNNIHSFLSEHDDFFFLRTSANCQSGRGRATTIHRTMMGRTTRGEEKEATGRMAREQELRLVLTRKNNIEKETIMSEEMRLKWKICDAY